MRKSKKYVKGFLRNKNINEKCKFDIASRNLDNNKMQGQQKPGQEQKARIAETWTTKSKDSRNLDNNKKRGQQKPGQQQNARIAET